MTPVAAAAPSVFEDVVRLLAERVPAAVLDRVMLELLDIDRVPHDEELQALLEHGAVTAALKQELGNSSCSLLGIRTDQAAQLLSRVRLAADAYRLRLRTVTLRGTLWVLLPSWRQRWAEEVLSAPDLPDHLTVARQVADLRLLPSLRTSVDELLDLGVRRGWTGVADGDRLQTARRVEALLDLAAARPELVDGPLDGLLDDSGNTVLATTLHAWFMLDRDTLAVAEHLHLHVNTVRYRLRRAQGVTGVDLSDPDQRLLAELQLRLWQASAERAA